MEELPIIQKTYDLIKWYVPILNRLPKNHKFILGKRMTSGLYDFLEQLIKARYERQKITRLENLNSRLDILRYQTRLLLDFQQMDAQRYGYICQRLDAIGNELGGWIRQQKGKHHEAPRKSLAPHH
ncbi:MAG: diversity-generating retroelement protein Avd [Cyanobacteria bacterium P01_F01_bin.86]